MQRKYLGVCFKQKSIQKNEIIALSTKDFRNSEKQSAGASYKYVWPMKSPWFLWNLREKSVVILNVETKEEFRE